MPQCGDDELPRLALGSQVMSGMRRLRHCASGGAEYAKGAMMRTEADVRSEVILAVFDDRDRSLEGAVERAVRAGIEFERERIRAILELSPRPGLEKAMIALAVHGETTVENATNFIATYPFAANYSESLRKTFRVVSDNSEPGKASNV
jgi:hypothetical protein